MAQGVPGLLFSTVDIARYLQGAKSVSFASWLMYQAQRKAYGSIKVPLYFKFKIRIGDMERTKSSTHPRYYHRQRHTSLVRTLNVVRDLRKAGKQSSGRLMYIFSPKQQC